MRPALVALLLSLFAAACAGVGTESLPGRPVHHVEGGFRNSNPEFKRPSAWLRWSFFARRVWDTLTAPKSIDLPREQNDGHDLRENRNEATVTWIGHSTLLVQLDGVNLLTDPHWGPRASPVSWAGPMRFSAPGLSFEHLPRIDLVVISHDHYDHLDLGTITRLSREHDPLFLVPLGLKGWLAEQGITRVEELDWWGSVEQRGLRLVCVPAQHFGGRAPWDMNRRLWASWVVLGGAKRLYFGGDSGYFDGFKEAGDRLGPFDLAALGIGAYKPDYIMKAVHTTPEEAVQAFEDLRARTLLGIHWGTFDLADEPLDEPPLRLIAEVKRRGIDPGRAWILKHGETRRW